MDGGSTPPPYTRLPQIRTAEKLSSEWVHLSWSMYVIGEWGTIGGRPMRPTDRLGSDVSGGRTYLPYGEELNPVPGGAFRFAMYWRDEGSELDYADQRYYQRTMGRFLTADPYLASGGASEPGSWNRYAYTRGDPVNRVDPRGLDDCSPDADFCTTGTGRAQTFCEAWPNHPNCGLGSSSGESRQEYGSPVTSATDLLRVATDYRKAVERGTYKECEGMSHYADFVASHAPQLMVDAFKALYQPEFGGTGGPLNGKGTGFRPEFQDEASPGSDQSHHFAFFFVQGAALSYANPEEAAAAITGGAFFLELGNMMRDHVFNGNDVRLGVAAGMMGYRIGRAISEGRIDSRYGFTSAGPRDLGSWIRAELCNH